MCGEEGEMISGSCRPKMRGDLRQTQLEDGSVLYDRGGQMAYTLNLTASLIASYLDGALSLEEIADEVTAISGAEKKSVLNDITDIVSLFEEKALLERGSL